MQFRADILAGQCLTCLEYVRAGRVHVVSRDGERSELYCGRDCPVCSKVNAKHDGSTFNKLQ